MDYLAQGFVEVTGYVAAVQAADIMAKTADVTVRQIHKVDGPRVCVICEGDVAACKAAVDAAVDLCRPQNMLIAANVIPHPADQGALYGHLDAINAAKAARKKARAAARRSRKKSADATGA